MENKIYRIIATLNKNGIKINITDLDVDDLDKVYRYINSETGAKRLIYKKDLGLNKSKFIQKIDHQTRVIYCLPEDLHNYVVSIKKEFKQHYIDVTNMLTELISNQDNLTINYEQD